jgi:hypothetical protein
MLPLHSKTPGRRRLRLIACCSWTSPEPCSSREPSQEALRPSSPLRSPTLRQGRRQANCPRPERPLRLVDRNQTRPSRTEAGPFDQPFHLKARTTSVDPPPRPSRRADGRGFRSQMTARRGIARTIIDSPGRASHRAPPDIDRFCRCGRLFRRGRAPNPYVGRAEPCLVRRLEQSLHNGCDARPVLGSVPEELIGQQDLVGGPSCHSSFPATGITVIHGWKG